MAEQFTRNEQVVSSILTISSKALRCGGGLFFITGRDAKTNERPKAPVIFQNRMECGSHRARDLAGTQAAGAGVYTLRGTVHKRLDSLDVRLPSSVGASVRVRDLNAEGHVLAANFAFCHCLHLLNLG